MPVELRCPECRTKLRLSESPEAGTEIECPKCGHAFPAPEPDAGPKPLPDDMKAKKPAGASGTSSVPMKKAPKRRRAVKNKANKKLLAVVITGGLFVLGSIVGALVWYTGRKSVAVELLSYLPDDADKVMGANVGHAQKYPEVFKLIEPAYTNMPFKKAADAAAAACGFPDGKEFLAYAITSTSKGGGITVAMRSKKEFSPDALGKLPGASPSGGDGGKFFTATVDGLGQVRAFAPTNRIVVFCSTSVSQAAFTNAMRGNKENPKAFHERMGTLGKRMTKGTVWQIVLFDTPPPKPEVVEPGLNDQGMGAYTRMQGDMLSASQGVGFKASLGSRAVRLEIALTYRDDEAAKNMAAKFKDSEWAKGDDAEPPREWKFLKQQFGDQKVAREFFNSLGFTSSANVFAAYAECDTVVLMQHMSGLLGRLTGTQGALGVAPTFGSGPPPGMTTPKTP